MEWIPNQDTVVIVIINSKNSRGLQQSLSLFETPLVAVLQFLWIKVRPEGEITSSVASFCTTFSSLGLDYIFHVAFEGAELRISINKLSFGPDHGSRRLERSTDCTDVHG